MSRYRHFSVLLAVALAPTVASAATPIDEHREVNPDVHVRIENVAGRVEVHAGSDDRIEISGSLGEGSKPLRIEGDRERLSIKVEAENGGWGGSRMVGSDLIVRVPRKARVAVNTVSADIDVDGVSGTHADIETVSGSIGFNADSERVALKSVSGRIRGEGAGKDWNVGTVSGRIDLPKAAGELRVESVSGSIELDFGRAERLRAETVSGKIVAAGELLPGGSIGMQSVSGTLDLVLSGTVDARINAKTFSGPIESDFGTPERGGIGGGKSLNTTVGNGSADVRLESFSGRVRIRGN